MQAVCSSGVGAYDANAIEEKKKIAMQDAESLSLVVSSLGYHGFLLIKSEG